MTDELLDKAKNALKDKGKLVTAIATPQGEEKELVPSGSKKIKFLRNRIKELKAANEGMVEAPKYNKLRDRYEELKVEHGRILVKLEKCTRDRDEWKRDRDTLHKCVRALTKEFGDPALKVISKYIPKKKSMQAQPEEESGDSDAPEHE